MKKWLFYPTIGDITHVISSIINIHMFGRMPRLLKMAHLRMIFREPFIEIIMAYNLLINLTEKILGLPLVAIFPDTGVSGEERLME